MTIGAKVEDWFRLDRGTKRRRSVFVRFNKVGAEMHREDEAGEALEDVAGIHGVVDRLRDLIVSATALDLKASAGGYWAAHEEDGRATISP